MVTDFGCKLNNRGGRVGVNHAHDQTWGEKPSRKIKGMNDVVNFTLVSSETSNKVAPTKVQTSLSFLDWEEEFMKLKNPNEI